MGPRRSFRAAGGVVVLGALTFVTPARADEARQPADSIPARPITYASVELNPLVLLIGRVSGQLQVGVYGPLSIVASVGRLSFSDSLHYSSYDETVFGGPSLEGTLFELGPRAFLPLGTRWVYVWGQPSFLVDALEQGPTLACPNGTGSCKRGEDAVSIRRTGFALDAGFHIRLVPGAYITLGFGVSHKSKADGYVDATSNSPVSLGRPYESGQTNLRVLASVGVGF